MQSGNGIAEMEQQFMVDDCCSSFFPVSHNSMNHLQRQSRMFQHLHPHIPITHQLFQHQQQFQAFQQQRLHHRLALGHQSISGCDNSPSDSGVLGGAPFPFFAVNFKEAAEHIPESRAAVAMSQCWQTQDPSAIKEPFWKPLDIEYVINRNHKRCEEEKVEGSSKTIEQVQERDQGEHYDNKYGLFGELEAIYSRENIQRGSGSALTGENLPTIAGLQGHFGEPHPELPTAVIDHGSETSIGEEASLRKLQKRRTERKRKQLSSITAFFENLIKQMMNHQEGLHRKFLEVIERRDQKRADLEEAWRRQEAAKFNSEAIARAREQALASSREDTIVSYLEKITGQSISLPIRTQFDQFQPQIHGEGKPVEINDVVVNLGNPSTTSRRWPKAEVQALIRVRSSLESKFQEPGLKGTLWER
ncbi:hypothetical protein HHK36_031825 [Tetracentron sinense]|uniref:Uncharacterized protein n=1 Tax=Tetracentron sinense TaxID=13715 RepID=A0A834YB00_TETSI|nr:hypothetical protein HHK36_031825 [Tetracentron sinense]